MNWQRRRLLMSHVRAMVLLEGTLLGIARVDGRVVCKGQMSFALGEKPAR